MSDFRRFPLMAYRVKNSKSFDDFKLMPQIIKRVKLRAGITPVVIKVVVISLSRAPLNVILLSVAFS